MVLCGSHGAAADVEGGTMRIDPRYRPELCVSEDETRYQIMDPFFDAAAGKVVATNGHMMILLPATTEEGEASGYVEPAGGSDVAERLRDFAREQARAARRLARDVAELLGPPKIVPAADDRRFPDWKFVLPKFQEGDPGTVSVALSAAYLASIAKAIGA